MNASAPATCAFSGDEVPTPGPGSFQVSGSYRENPCYLARGFVTTGGSHVPLVHVQNFSYGLVNPVLGFLMSCLGAFIGLRCLTRARAYAGRVRALWLSLAAIAIGATGGWG